MAASSAVSHRQVVPASATAAAAGSMMSRVERLDMVVGYLEEMRSGNGNGNSKRLSSSTATTTTNTLSSSSPPSSPGTSGGRSRRTAEELLQETKAKGSLVERIASLEDRVLSMEAAERHQLQLAAARSSSSPTATSTARSPSSKEKQRKKKKKGVKDMVKSCVRGGKLSTKD